MNRIETMELWPTEPVIEKTHEADPQEQKIHVGQRYTITPEDRALATKIANAQHEASGSRGTRNAGSDQSMRWTGAIGEIVVAQMMGIEPQVRALSGPDAKTDIMLNGEEYEVKNGLPMEAKSKIRPNATYIVVKCLDALSGVYCLTHIATGQRIIEANLPATMWETRAGTQGLNWRIP